jgi:hypothetical protein
MSSELDPMVLTPSPSRLAESLRDTGYSYQAAFADIVDNSVAAGASNVNIEISDGALGTALRVVFYDDGCGMTREQLLDAMRYGSKKRSIAKSLGKFGMGLKTASTAFCRRLIVISMSGEGITASAWDLDHIIDTDSWELSPVDVASYAEEVENLEELAVNGTGTVVIWEKIDRLIANSGSDYVDKAVQQLTDEISSHLSATFGKFLIGTENFGKLTRPEESTSAPEIRIALNNSALQGWDPTGSFLNSSSEPDRVLTERTQREVVVTANGRPTKATYELNGYVLPNKSQMTESELAAVRYSNDNQGFYVYREDRLIFSGGWPHRLFAQDSHLNLLRVELNFGHDLDDYFEIDIRKSKINIPAKQRDELKTILAPWRNEAQKRYRGEKKKSKGGTGNPSDPVHQSSSTAIERQHTNTSSIQIKKIDSASKNIVVENRFGETTISRAQVVEGTEIFVTSVHALDGKMLWEVAVNGGHTAVVLNESHEFYKRFYLSGVTSPALVQAMDSMFWALANAELASHSDVAKENFTELRFCLSKDLGLLAQELPDVD